MLTHLLSVEHIYKSFDLKSGSYAVSDVGFTLRRGECLGIAGESGSGKSTLIRMIARLSDVSPGPNGENGYINMSNKTISLWPPHLFASHPLRKKIQMVFQDPDSSLNPCFTAFSSIADPLRALCGMRKKEEIKKRVYELADLVQLPHELLSRLPHQLSGGQKARVGIARALAPGPDLILLDEPTTALDVSVQGRILTLLDDLKRNLGLSMIFVSHDLSVLKLLCDNILVMLRGKTVEYAPVEQLFSNPASGYGKSLLEAMPKPPGRSSQPPYSGPAM
ncbi:MAG: ATP-binding cassette domain-containing protein [Desulfovibrio sp.]|jgi:peptide/nickel transport system ATP-binding protein|nr:ATP-binding cassette domain-containing protein [Desulfovibrio sp.]